ncbi:RRP36 [Mytilus edulis]|uniref:rRNA biogenesis protein RRP36 n=1 Tax=Mytilus edulis TaxID=6550 RepID=A0A8S3S9D1_MYTED|nr:RRP36 [Mytilus edulis]
MFELSSIKDQQEQSEKQKDKRKTLEKEWKKKEQSQVKEGKKPFFLKKTDLRKLELAEKYKELQKSGKLENYLTSDCGAFSKACNWFPLVLTPTKYKGEPVGVVVNRDIVTSPYNPNKACNRLVFYTSSNDRGKRSRIDFEDGFDIDHPDLLRTPPHTSPVITDQSKEAIQAAIQAARPDTPYQQHQRSKMKAKRPTDSSL